jgi:hypothetical protein
MNSNAVVVGGETLKGATLGRVRLVPLARFLIDKDFANFCLRSETAAPPSNATNTMSDSEAEGGVPLIEPEFDVVPASNKRKRGVEPEASAETKKANKKAKRKEKKKQKAKAINEDDLDQELGVNHAFERMDSQLLTDYINSRTRHYGKELSSVELEDKFIPGKFQVFSPVAHISHDYQAILLEIAALGINRGLSTTQPSFSNRKAKVLSRRQTSPREHRIRLSSRLLEFGQQMPTERSRADCQSKE